MKTGDLVTVIRSSQFLGKIAVILDIIPSKGIFVTFASCLVDGSVRRLPISWLEVISETR